MNQSTIFANKLNEIRPKFLAQVLQRLDRFDEIRDELETSRNLDAQVAEIRMGVHKTVGLAGSLGFDDLGQLSAQVETALIDLGENGGITGPLPAEVLALLDDLLGEMALVVG